MNATVSRWFELEKFNTSVRTEVLGGVTTFVTMAYIIVVNPAILSFAGIPVGTGTVATILTSAIGCLLMGFYANRPIAVAPYMGENAFVAFGLMAMGVTMEQRLGAVFVSGMIFFIMTLSGIRQWLAESVSSSLKYSFAVGIGLFLAFIGLYQAGIVTSFVTGMPARQFLLPDGNLLRAPEVPVKIGHLKDLQVMLSIGGFVLMGILLQRKVRGAILIGIVVTALAGAAMGCGAWPVHFFGLPFQGEATLEATLFKMDLTGILKLSFLPVLLTLFLMCFLDTLGTLIGLGAAANLLNERGNFPEIEKPMMVDAGINMIAACLGTSTSGAYIESAAGIREGARTGLCAVVVGLLFLVSLFFVPLLIALQKFQFAYAPALIMVGVLMISEVSRIDFSDLTEAIPAFATMVMTVFTYNIGNGLTAGLVLHPLLKLACGRRDEIRSGSLLLALFCLIYYVFGVPH